MRKAMTLLTTAQIAERYGVQMQTVSRWCQRGLFPNLMKGRKTGHGAIYLIPESDLESFTPPRRGRPAATKSRRRTTTRRRSRKRRKEGDQE
jgi:hypothetical protein